MLVHVHHLNYSHPTICELIITISWCRSCQKWSFLHAHDETCLTWTHWKVMFYSHQMLEKVISFVVTSLDIVFSDAYDIYMSTGSHQRRFQATCFKVDFLNVIPFSTSLASCSPFQTLITKCLNQNLWRHTMTPRKRWWRNEWRHYTSKSNFSASFNEMYSAPYYVLIPADGTLSPSSTTVTDAHTSMRIR